MRDDIAEEILLRLPVKSLARCKTLSKDWQEFISRNPSFRKRFIERNRDCSFMVGLYVTKHVTVVEEQLHFLPTYNRGISVVNKRKRRNDGLLDEPAKKKGRDNNTAFVLKKSPNFFSNPAVRVLGSSNGFLLCSLDEKCPLNYMIINPINKLCMTLPIATVAASSDTFYSHGFICRSLSPQLDTIDYYKVVRGVSPDDWHQESPTMLDIISSDSSCWSLHYVRGLLPFDLDYTTPSKIIISDRGLVYVPGKVYKAEEAEEATTNVIDNGVLIFDESKQGVQIMELPPTENKWNCQELFGLSEGLISYARIEVGQLKIWRMNDQQQNGGGGWSLIHNVNLESWLQMFKCKSTFEFVPSAFHPTDKNVIFFDFTTETLTYHLDKSKVESICDNDTEGWESIYYFFPYTCGLIGPHLFLGEG
ncbi:hypothetical protein ACHQM5_017904 [Ranunculus cassubicifolius]